MIDKRGLQRFTKAVDYLANEDEEYRSVIGNALARVGQNIAEDEFHKFHYDNGNIIKETPYATDYTIIVSANQKYIGLNEVVAHGNGVMFAEFGTGILGEQGNYQGELYNGRLVFESRGDIQRTRGYVYNYFAKQHQDEEPEDWIGFPPVAGLWKAGNYLRENYREIAKEALKGTRYGFSTKGR